MQIFQGTARPLWLAALFLCQSAQAQDPQVSTDRTTYLPSEPVRVRFADGPGNLLDWVGLYNEGVPGQTFIVWLYLDGSSTGRAPLNSGEVVFPRAPSRPGNYEVRMYANDGYGLLAENKFTVANSPRLLLTTNVFAAAAPVSITFTNAPGAAKDWIGLFAPDAPNTAPISRLYLDGTATGAAAKTNGTVNFPGITALGRYEARLFQNDAVDQPLDRIAFSVGFSGPTVSATPGNGTVTLKWPALNAPVAIEKYVVLSRPSSSGAFTAIGEVAAQTGEHSFQHSGLNNGQENGYLVRSLGAGGLAVAESTPVFTAPVALPSSSVLAYDAPPGTIGSQAWNGALGMEFELVSGVTVSRLGVFDDGSDGLKRNITARLYDRTSRQQLASLEFTPAAPGALVRGHRFKPLAAPLTLNSGFKGVIVAEGYGPGETAANGGLTKITWQTNDASGSVLFVGRGRFGPAGEFPGTIDKGPANRYAAGTFEFRVNEVNAPSKPNLTVVPDDSFVTLSWPRITAPVPAATYRILRSFNDTGPFTQITQVTEPTYVDRGLVNGTEVCYKVIAISASGVAGPESEVVCQTPEPPAAGVAYINPAGLPGNQNFGGSVGNDFDVVRPIRITRLGVFDDGSDGLQRPITVRLYNRATETELARLVLTPSDSGTLVEGSRFKTLREPIVLDVGFQGSIVASGYGTGELVGNKGIGAVTDMPLETFTGGSLKFVGSSRWGESPDAFPGIIDGGPANRYAAGTFYFEPRTVGSDPKLSVRLASGKVTLTWERGTLETATSLAGPWQPVAGAVSGVQIVPSDPVRFYRIRL